MTPSTPVFARRILHLSQRHRGGLPLVFPQAHGADPQIAFTREPQHEAGITIGGVRPHLTGVLRRTWRTNRHNQESERGKREHVPSSNENK